MCGGDDHLAWKHPVSSEACRGLCTAGGGLFVVIVLVQCPGLSGIEGALTSLSWRMDTQQSRHVVLEDTPSNIVTPPILPVQMPAMQTLHDQATVIPPIVTPVTIIEDSRSRMDRLERRIGQMRDPDEMISWDDPDDVPMATCNRFQDA
ncbi:hypothetical protein CK203_083305 [Vitis vinifera]|uniref:Uncharacterized protein n=1 Tax=Vitis vinifera TaxID=29760 RepID=A0A438CZR4_VITVI|nr:hypothetical protein CK203_083305 [Vitis vinifera]